MSNLKSPSSPSFAASLERAWGRMEEKLPAFWEAPAQVTDEAAAYQEIATSDRMSDAQAIRNGRVPTVWGRRA